MHGEWPEHEVDHKNLDSLDDRLENLRVATPSQNQANKGMRKDNTSGVKGVAWDSSKKKWAASTSLGGRSIHLGRYDRIEDAAKAYAEGVAQIHGDFGRAEVA